jgi:hypothetical protein
MPDTDPLPPEDTPVGRLYYGRHRTTFRIGTYLALVRMMGIAHLVTALYGHALLVSQTQTRLARTRQTLRELICSGFDSPAGRAAVQRLRDVHRPIQAGAADYRYVLGTFFLEPLRWNRLHARRALDAGEQALLLDFWMQVGRAMQIDGLPTTLAQWQQMQRDYEAEHLRFTPEGQALARLCLRDVVKLTVPPGTRWVFRQWMLATLDPMVRDALGLRPPAWHARLALALVRRAMA